MLASVGKIRNLEADAINVDLAAFDRRSAVLSRIYLVEIKGPTLLSRLGGVALSQARLLPSQTELHHVGTSFH